MAESSRHTAVFLDTSIQIARRLREAAMCDRIKSRLQRYSLRVSSSIVLQEFKNRVLRDVAYLLSKLRQTNSYMATLNYVTNVLPKGQQRKMRVCVPLLHKILPLASDAELTERGMLYLRTLLVYGQSQFTRELDALVADTDCHWSKVPIVEKRKYASYDFGSKRCDASKGLCRVGETLKLKEARCKALLAFLDGLPANRLTEELTRGREALRRVIGNNFENIHGENLCLSVGDLLIALDSENVSAIYTMNYRESQAFCDFLNQTLVVRPNNPEADDVEFDPAKRPWPPLSN